MIDTIASTSENLDSSLSMPLTSEVDQIAATRRDSFSNMSVDDGR